jgi:hypothetical protein
MAKRSSTANRAPQPSAGLERQIEAFAEQLGYVAGSIHSRAEGVVDRKALTRQVTTVRDSAKSLLGQLASGVTSRVRRKPATKRPVRKARSGGTVDAPGKKHRKASQPAPPPAAERTRNARMTAATHGSKGISHRPRQS